MVLRLPLGETEESNPFFCVALVFLLGYHLSRSFFFGEALRILAGEEGSDVFDCFSNSFLICACCFLRAAESVLSTVGRFLTSSAASKLSSLGALSLPDEESPSPTLSNFLLFESSATNDLVNKMAYGSPAEFCSAENVFLGRTAGRWNSGSFCSSVGTNRFCCTRIVRHRSLPMPSNMSVVRCCPANGPLSNPENVDSIV